MYSQVFAATTQQTTSGDLPMVILGLFISLLTVVGLWGMFRKAKQPGWAAIIPIYNMVVYLRIIGWQWWWIFLMVMPFVNVVVTLFTSFDAAKVFGKSKLFGILGLWILTPVGALILGFGDAKYHPPHKPESSKDATEE